MPEIDTSIEHYLGQARLSSKTKEVYGIHLRAYRSWCESVSLRIEEARPKQLQQYFDHLRASGMRESTVGNKFYALKGYYAWLESMHVVAASPMAKLWIKRIEAGPTDSVPLDDLRALLNAADSDRTWALIALLSVNSLRISELVGCDASDLEMFGATMRLRFQPHAPSTRVPHTVVPPEVAAVLRRYLGRRSTGPLFLDGKNQRMSRSTAADIVARTGRRAGLPYKVTPQMLAYCLPVTALEEGFSYLSILRSIGLIQPRHARRWLHYAESTSGQHAPVRMARMVLAPPDETESLLIHAEALLSETPMPDAFAVMGAAAVLERHLRLLCIANGIPVPTEAKEGSINGYAAKLRQANLIDNAELHLIENIGALRNKASHGRFEHVHDGVGAPTLRTIRGLVERHPLPADGGETETDSVDN